MKKTILTILALAAAGSALSACVEYRGGPPPRVVAERQGWVPGPYDRFGGWVEGHWR